MFYMSVKRHHNLSIQACINSIHKPFYGTVILLVTKQYVKWYSNALKISDVL